MNNSNSDLSQLKVIPVRVILPNGSRVDEAYDRETRLRKVREDFQFEEGEIEIMINGRRQK